ncbi:MAG: tyrosine protein kinase [Tannerella sp.]|jgi:uncharacterized protein involved in exopolysaccharide biosynthesis|nr:tyrosine protein kinase [Tannerella sp.]
MENKDKESLDLKGITVKYLRSWKLFAAVFVFSFIPAILYLALYPRTYEIKAAIQLREDKESGMSGGIGEAAGLMKSFGIGGLGGGSINIDDEMSILTSNRLMRSMILDLGINIQYSKPFSFYYMYKEAPLKLTADPETLANLDDEYRFNVSVAQGNIKVKAKSLLGKLSETFTYTSLPAFIKIDGHEFRLDFDNDGASKTPFKLQIRCTPASWFAETLADKIEVEEVSSSSNVIEIVSSDHSRDRGKDVLNTLVKKLNEDFDEYESIEDRKTLDFVDERISRVTTDLAKVELDIEAFKAKNEMTDIEADMKMYSGMMQELQNSIIEIESQTRLINSLDEYVRKPENKYSVVPTLLTSAGGEKGGAIGTYNEALMKREKILSNSNEQNPLYKTLTIQVDKLREGVFTTIENTRKGYDATLKDLKQKERQLMSKFRSVPKEEREYVIFRRDQEIYQGLYLLLLQKREETVLALNRNAEHARLVEPAYVAKKPLGPRKLYAAIGMLVLTLVVPVAYLLIRDMIAAIREEMKKKD